MNEQIENVTYDLNGKKVKPNLLKSDIKDEMKKRAYDLALEALEKYMAEKVMGDERAQAHLL